MNKMALYALCLCSLILATTAWAPNHVPVRYRQQQLNKLSVSTSKIEEINNDEDWRDFRAQLVRSENNNVPKEDKQPSDNDHWAYDTGDFVERGSIVLSVPSTNQYLNDIDILNNISYRKSIVLVLDVSPYFIQGIILNRPTNIGVKDGNEVENGWQFVQPGHGEVFENELGNCLGENCELDYGNDGNDISGSAKRWKVWFGGEVNGPYSSELFVFVHILCLHVSLYLLELIYIHLLLQPLSRSENPTVMCIHSINTESAISVSDTILPSIYVTSFDGAQYIVQNGDADPSDFWLFSGICGWETSTFYNEMHEEGLWHIVSTDSGTVLEELNMLRCEEEEEMAIDANCDVDSDPRNAGLHTWEMLCEKIGLEKEVYDGSSSDDEFGDLMLHEWATSALSFSIKDDQTTTSSMIIDPASLMDENDFDLEDYDPASVMSVDMDDTLINVEPTQSSRGVVGVMVRASSAERSPYLLDDQGYHKSLILILSDSEDYSEGVMLNHVTDRILHLDLGGDRSVELPIRYGGPAGEDDEDSYETPAVFLHSSVSLRDAGVGEPIGKSRISRCTQEEVIKALKSGLATADDIMVIQGSSMWTKKGEHSGILGDVESRLFELVPRPKVKQVYNALQRQKLLTEDTLLTNVATSRQAWNTAGKDGSDVISKKDRIQVFGTDVDVTTLADEANMRWVKVNLLQ